MYLKSLTLKGFKSFADRTVMRFEPGLAAIVGPNGSGKSNISDAVLWVLGERNAKNLRGQSMDDVIFAGSTNRKQVSVAEVELCLDNSDGTLPVDYSEVSVGRRMYRSGESEYLINGTVVRRMDVLDILHDSGLGTGTNSIISQGNLDSVLSSKPEDRRALIEEAAGILKHKERKRRSLRKLERMDNNVARVRDITREVERQLKPLERKAKRAQTYNELNGQLTDLKLRLAVDDLKQLQQQWDLALQKEVELSAQLQTAKEALDASQRDLDGLQQRLDSQGRAANALNTDFRRAQNARERLNSQIMLVREKRSHAFSELERTSRELEENRQRQRAAQAEVVAARELAGQAETAQRQAKERLAALSKEHDAKRIERNELRKRIDTLTTEQRGIVHRLETAQAASRALQEERSESEARARVLETQVAEARQRLAEAEEAARNAAERAMSAETALSALIEQEREARSRMSTTLVERDDARKRCDAARETFATRSAERSALEELERAADRPNAALGWLLDGGAGIQGATPVSHGIVAPPHLEPLVEALLGPDLRAVVVEGALEKPLEALVQSSVTGEAVLVSNESSAERSTANARMLLDELEVASAQAQAVTLLLGDVRLVDTYQQALAGATSAGVRFASLDGCIAYPDGKAAFFRKDAGQQDGSLARHRTLVDLRSAEASAKSDYNQLVEACAKLESLLRTHQAATLKLSEELAGAKGRCTADANEAKRTRALADTLSAELTKLVAEHDRNAQVLSGSVPRTESLASEIVQCTVDLDANKQALANLDGQLAPVQHAVLELSQKLSDARLDVARLDERLAYAKRMVQTRESEAHSLVRRLGDAEHTRTTANLVAERTDPLLTTLGRLVDAANLLTLSLEQQTQQEANRSQGLNGQITQATAVMRQAHEAHDQVSEQLAGIRIEKSRLEVQVETAIKVITVDHETAVETALALDPLDERDQAERQAGSLERRIKNLGTINPDAAKEYEQIRERHAYLASQLADMDAARVALARITEVIDERMRDDFLNTFNQVNDNFSEIFGILFPGGQAHLALVDPDDLEGTGVDVNAQPVGKKVKKMSLLSGGEKSMTAMALLFAVYRIRQTPFYILDEVEAALDDTNLRRLMSYLDTIRNQTQFIMITHQRRTMESADILYGVSMQADGVTKVLSQKLEIAAGTAKEK